MMALLVIWAIVGPLVAALIGGAIALTAYRQGKLPDNPESPCPACGAVEVVEMASDAEIARRS
jgi:hypothetical protein